MPARRIIHPSGTRPPSLRRSLRAGKDAAVHPHQCTETRTRRPYNVPRTDRHASRRRRPVGGFVCRLRSVARERSGCDGGERG